MKSHSDKRTVIKLMSYPPRHPERIRLLDRLRNSGNDRFNKDPNLNPTGERIFKRRLAKNKVRPISPLRNDAKTVDNSSEEVKSMASSEILLETNDETTKDFNGTF